MASREHLTAAEAARALGVSAATLYAYVSRGLIRSEPSADARRTRLYRREDIELLNSRKQARRNPIQAAERNLSWGLPVLESALTLISEGRLYYRGHEATGLAAARTVEEVASLIWEGEFRTDYRGLFEMAATRLKDSPVLRVKLPNLSPLERFRAILALAEGENIAAYNLDPAALLETGARIVVLLTQAAAPRTRWREGMARTLQSAWAPGDRRAEQLIRAALIMLVDHELAVSSFTARCVASAGSPLYAVVEAGLCALRGIKHGGATERAEQFLREAASARSLRKLIGDRLRRGDHIPGFGHMLYPDGDPRARFLLEMLSRDYANSPAASLARAIMKEARRVSERMRPNIDFAGAVLALTLALPAGSAVAIFALGRTIGWIGHAIEQYQIDRLIRPRARYVGPPPPGAAAIGPQKSP
ncbi:MAG TPA: citrate synthase family protein [Candidatus Binataceae bacterium]|nr:citrate synthase family protein [Candidatus Binataceae bacterium]